MDSTDPIAAKTQWTPLVPGGSNFVTHRLVQLDAARFEMRPSAGLKLFGAAFLVVGVGTSLVGLLNSEWMATLFGLPFAAAGVYVLWPSPLVFDGSARLFTSKKGSVITKTPKAVGSSGAFFASRVKMNMMERNAMWPAKRIAVPSASARPRLRQARAGVARMSAT